MLYDMYFKALNFFNKNKQDFDIDLVKSIIATKNALVLAINNYEYADDELIDYYSYQIKANSSKLSYLLKKAKQNGLLLDMVNQIKINSLDKEVI